MVPKEDILGLENEDYNVQKRDNTNSSNTQYSSEQDQPVINQKFSLSEF